MKEPVIDPAAEVLLDFQSVMAQFLELQTSVIDAVAARGGRSTGVPAVVDVPITAPDALPVPAPTVIPVAAAPAQAPVSAEAFPISARDVLLAVSSFSIAAI